MDDLRHVKGLAELDAFLATLPEKLQRNVLRGALRAGAGVIRDAAKANVATRSGDLARSLKIGSFARDGQVVGRVRTRLFYAPMVEFGTKPHTITAANRKGLAIGGLFFQSVEHPGAQEGSFMRAALDSHADAALAAVARKLQERLTKEGLEAGAVELGGDEE